MEEITKRVDRLEDLVVSLIEQIKELKSQLKKTNERIEDYIKANDTKLDRLSSEMKAFKDRMRTPKDEERIFIVKVKYDPAGLDMKEETINILTKNKLYAMVVKGDAIEEPGGLIVSYGESGEPVSIEFLNASARRLVLPGQVSVILETKSVL